MSVYLFINLIIEFKTNRLLLFFDLDLAIQQIFNRLFARVVWRIISTTSGREILGRATIHYNRKRQVFYAMSGSVAW